VPDNDARSREEEYFWKKDQELIEKMRRAAAAEQAKRDMGAKAGLDDPEMIQELQALGFTTDTVVLLPLMPLVQIAWAEGGVSDAERQLIVKLARSWGIVEGSAADHELSAWLASRPDAQVFTRATRLIRAMLASTSSAHIELTADDLVTYCESIAAASGGVLGMKRISAEERALLATIASELKARDK
jgi:hypothetical protein